MDEIKTIAEFFARLFTPQQQVALVIMSFCVLVITYNFKAIWFGFYPDKKPKRKAAKIRLFAVISGIALGVVGAYIVPKQPMWFWVVSGILSSGGSIAIVDIYKKWVKREK